MRAIPQPYRDVELYMEHEGFDVRLALLKAKDFLQTMGDASLSLTYANKEMHNIEQEQLLNIIVRNHLRHALIDYNGCFDLLLQVPWILFRLWENVPYNQRGKKIQRNSENWVAKAEKICEYEILVEKLANCKEQKVKRFLVELKKFKKEYVDVRKNKIAIRSIVNSMKHKRNIQLEEFRAPNLLNINVNGMRTNSKILEEQGIFVAIKREIYNINNPSKTVAKITQTFKGVKSEVDIEYMPGELFRGIDLTDSTQFYRLNDLYDHAVIYHNKIVDLFFALKEVLDEFVENNPFHENIKFNKETSYNLDPFFTISQVNEELQKNSKTFINYGKHKKHKEFSVRKKYAKSQH